MQTNYYFLRQLVTSLKSRFNVDSGEISHEPLRFMACFSQDRDEVILAFAQARGKVNYYKPFYIKATLRPDFSGLYFPENVQRARQNSANLFDAVIGESGHEPVVTGVHSFLNERALAIELEKSLTLVFKFFGNRPNLLAFQNDTVIDLFNQQLATDEQLRLSGFDRPIDQSFAAFEQAEYDYRRLFPTFGKIVNTYLAEQGVGTSRMSAETQWSLIQNVLGQLESPQYYLTELEHKPALSLLPVGNIRQTFSDPIEAANRFYTAYNGLTTFAHEKANWLRLLDKRQKRLQGQIDGAMQQLETRETGATHEEMGHILMANLHDIPTLPGSKSPERVSLYDFYRDQPISLKLKPELSPQKNAENFYRKAKNEKIEEQYLIERVTNRENELAQLNQQRTDVTTVESLKELRRYVKQHHLTVDNREGQPGADAGPLFKEVMADGFRILIGRNARNNDLLTQKYAYKEDLWLHARDVSGSHVLLKYQAGKTFPRNVIERAAELAAWYSKRRTDSLCPVIVTPKKYVRKPKGLAEGQVIVEKEDVVLVAPRGE